MSASAVKENIDTCLLRLKNPDQETLDNVQENGETSATLAWQRAVSILPPQMIMDVGCLLNSDSVVQKSIRCGTSVTQGSLFVAQHVFNVLSGHGTLSIKKSSFEEVTQRLILAVQECAPNYMTVNNPASNSNSSPSLNDGLRERNVQLEQQVIESRRRIDSLTQALNQLKQETEARQAEFERQYSELLTMLEQGTSPAKNQLSQQVKSLEEQNRASLSEIVEHKKTIEELEKLNEGLVADIREKQALLEAPSQDPISQLQQEKESINQNLNQALEKNKLLQQRFDEVSNESATQQKRIHELEKRVLDLSPQASSNAKASLRERKVPNWAQDRDLMKEFKEFLSSSATASSFTKTFGDFFHHKACYLLGKQYDSNTPPAVVADKIINFLIDLETPASKMTAIFKKAQGHDLWIAKKFDLYN